MLVVTYGVDARPPTKRTQRYSGRDSPTAKRKVLGRAHKGVAWREIGACFTNPSAQRASTHTQSRLLKSTLFAENRRDNRTNELG